MASQLTFHYTLSIYILLFSSSILYFHTFSIQFSCQFVHLTDCLTHSSSSQSFPCQYPLLALQAAYSIVLYIILHYFSHAFLFLFFISPQLFAGYLLVLFSFSFKYLPRLFSFVLSYVFSFAYFAAIWARILVRLSFLPFYCSPSPLSFPPLYSTPPTFPC